jgi:flagellar P-ring protein precursor FlgI
VVSAVNGINEIVAAEGFKAEIVDQYMLRVRFPEKLQTESDAVKLLLRIRAVAVATSQRAQVIIDEATGMILAGEGVQISPCAFAVGDIHITVVSEDVVSQPEPGFGRGETAVVNRTRVEVTTQNTPPQALRGGATVEELVKNLTALNLTPPQLIAVFTKLKSGGFLHAELDYR